MDTDQLYSTIHCELDVYKIGNIFEADDQLLHTYIDFFCTEKMHIVY